MTQYVGPAWVTLFFVLVYYAFQINILRVKSRLARSYKDRGERFDRYFGQDREMLAADRVQLNMLEHMPVFLVLLWLHALFVSPSEATILGAIYTGSRAVYPFVLGKKLGRGVPLRIVAVTFTGYAIIAIFVVRIAMALA
jgi:uncharacterized membrane protein YecN with MAPEG domain